MDSVIALYDRVLQPVAPFTWFGLTVSTIDIVGAVRLCVIMRQLRDSLYRQYKARGAVPEPRSFARSALTTLTVVFGGELMISPLLGVPPSFMLSGTFTVLFTAIQALIDALPGSFPDPFLEMELPLSIVDGFTRALLLCNFIPSLVASSPFGPSSSPASPLAQAGTGSPWTLLVTSLVAANGGFFLANLFSLIHPHGMTMQTPPELLPYGWTTTDLWCAPLITGLYALMTHPSGQPVWGDVHAKLVGAEKVNPVEPENARALCAVILAVMFSVRTVKNFKTVADVGKKPDPIKSKTQ